MQVLDDEEGNKRIYWLFDRLARLGFVCYDVYDVVAKRDYYRVATSALNICPLTWSMSAVYTS